MNSSVGGGDIMLLAGNSHPALAQLVADRLGIRMGACLAYQRTDRETMVEIQESVRARAVYIVQTGVQDVNNAVMELLVMVYACKTSSARSVIGVLPFMPYSKQSKMRKRGCIVSKLLAKMMCTAGLTHVITMDLHQKEVQGFFDCPVDNLRASPFIIQYIREQIPDYRNAVIVAKDPASCKRATSYAERLRIGIAVIHGEAKPAYFEDGLGDGDDDDDDDGDNVEIDDGRTSPPSVPPRAQSGRRIASSASISLTEVDPSRIMSIGLNVVPMQAAKEKPPISVVGDVGGRIAIMVDDIIDDVRSFTAAAELLRERGAYKIYVMATHGLLSADAPRLIEESDIDEVVVTNTIPHELQKIQCHKIKTIDVSILFAEAIRRLHHQESLSYLFRNISTED